MTGISENVRATSEDFRRFSENLRMLPKMSEDIPTTFEHVNTAVNTIRMDCRHLKAFAIVIKGKEMIHNKCKMK